MKIQQQPKTTRLVVEPTPSWKICSSKWDHFPKIGMNIQKSLSCHHLENIHGFSGLTKKRNKLLGNARNNVLLISDTLQGINISHLGKRKIVFKMPFWGDMLVPWRVIFAGSMFFLWVLSGVFHLVGKSEIQWSPMSWVSLLMGVFVFALCFIYTFKKPLAFLGRCSKGWMACRWCSSVLSSIQQFSEYGLGSRIINYQPEPLINHGLLDHGPP